MDADPYRRQVLDPDTFVDPAAITDLKASARLHPHPRLDHYALAYPSAEQPQQSGARGRSRKERGDEQPLNDEPGRLDPSGPTAVELRGIEEIQADAAALYTPEVNSRGPNRSGIRHRRSGRSLSPERSHVVTTQPGAAPPPRSQR